MSLTLATIALALPIFQETGSSLPSPEGADVPGTPGTPAGPVDVSIPAGWRPLDGVAAMAGDEIVTLSEWDRLFTSGAPRSFASNDEQRTARLQALRDSITLALETQAGQDLGIDPREIERLINRNLTQKRREVGAAGFVDYLQEQGIDALSIQNGQSKELYRALYRNSVWGFPVADRRPTSDRFVRPGELRALYRANLVDLAPPDVVRLQVITIAAEQVGGQEQAERLAAECREEALAGEDFGELAVRYSSLPTERAEGGLTERLAIRNLIGPPQVFAREAQAGDLSEVLPAHTNDGTLAGARLMRLESKEKGGPAPEFEDAAIQRQLRQWFLKRREDQLMIQARVGLWNEAGDSIWQNPAFLPQSPSQPEGRTEPPDGAERTEDALPGARPPGARR